MTRLATVLLLAFAFAAPAFAEDAPKPQAPDQVAAEKAPVEKPARFRYANTWERWRGKPYAVRTLHPVDGATASEKVYEALPQANFIVEGSAAFRTR